MSSKNLSTRIAGAIIRFRYLLFLLFACAAVFCALSIGKVKINPDLRTFLPAASETKRGIAAMNDEFASFASVNVMVEDISAENAYALADKLRAVDHVYEVSFDETEAHYKDNKALINVSFDADDDKQEIKDAIEEVKKVPEGLKCYFSGSVDGDYNEQLAHEMVGVITIAVVVIVLVLLLTSRSYFEVVIFFIVFIFAALLNMGTNYWFGEISSITNSVAVILQLALAIDYAIIFAHRYQDEAENSSNTRDALVPALSKSIIEISSSSLTTISGLGALTLMQFRLGYDLGVVLAKGIICSMLTVFLLMPGLIMLFPKLLYKTRHKKLLPDIKGWGNFLGRYGLMFILIFAVVFPAAFVISNKTEFAFHDSSITELIPSARRTAIKKMSQTFGSDTGVAMLLPTGEYEKQRQVLSEASALSDIKSATGLCAIEPSPGLFLTDSFDYESLASFINIDPEQSRLLFRGYALSIGDFRGITGNVEGVKYPLCDLLMFLLEKIDDGTVNLTEEQAAMLAPLRGQLERGIKQLHGSKIDRLVFSTALDAESEEGIKLVEELRETAKKYYDEEDIIIVGDITSARDLRTSYKSDSAKISLLTIGFVFIILLFTFRSIPAAMIMVFVIQGSIWINFSFQHILGTRSSFVTHMIVSAIQMGATIDYAIVFMSRYLARRSMLQKKEAMAAAVNDSFPTIITSGTIMTAAGLLIAYRVSDVYVGHIGLVVGRGAALSVILVMSVLPQLCVLFDSVILRKRRK